VRRRVGRVKEEGGSKFFRKIGVASKGCTTSINDTGGKFAAGVGPVPADQALRAGRSRPTDTADAAGLKSRGEKGERDKPNWYWVPR
jgi:hypothetical protein